MSDKDPKDPIQADELDNAETNSEESWNKADDAVEDLEKLGHEGEKDDEK